MEIQSSPGTSLTGKVLAIVDWDGVNMLLIRYDEDQPSRRPWTLWPEDEAMEIH